MDNSNSNSYSNNVSAKRGPHKSRNEEEAEERNTRALGNSNRRTNAPCSRIKNVGKEK